MKTLKIFTLLALLVTFSKTTVAQMNEQRVKIEMSLDYGGKKIITALNSVSTSLARTETQVPAKADTTSKIKGLYGTGIYMNIDVAIVSDDLLRLLAKKDAKVNGTITITDTYGKLPSKTIVIKNAILYSLSDQYSTSVYGDAYGSAMISLTCDQVSVNGITLEQ